MQPLTSWAVIGLSAVELVDQVGAALDGRGPAVAPHGAAASSLELPPTVPDGVAAVLATSGSAGHPRGVLLDGAALVASAEATHDRLGGPGRWLLSLPAEHVAGLQVLVRSVLSGVPPVLADPRDMRAVAAAARAGGARYAAIVPTQLHRLLAEADGKLPPDLAPLADLEAILVGGAATPAPLLDRGRALGLRLVTTYGSTETCGGCVYDGVPLTGVEVRLDGGVVAVAGPVLARGYLDGPGDRVGPLDGASATDVADLAGFVVQDGRRWFRTADLAGWAPDGRLEVLGRRDDVLVVGGANVWPQAVERVLADLPTIGEVCVVGRADERWGQVPIAVVVPGGGVPDLDQARGAVMRTLGSAAAPRGLVMVDRLPVRASGKVDRAAAARLAEASLAPRAAAAPDEED